MKELISDFFKLQNDRMKSPFFSAIVFSLFFYNWDIIYFLISSDLEVVTKIEYIKKTIGERSLLKPFLLTAVLLILPIFINNAVQWLSDFFISIRVNRLNKSKIKRANDELAIANLEAEKSFSARKIEMHVQNNIDAIQSENSNLKTSVDDCKEQIEALKLSLDSEREASVDSRKHADFLVNELESAKSELGAFETSIINKDEEIFSLKELLAQHENINKSQVIEIINLKNKIEKINVDEGLHFTAKGLRELAGDLISSESMFSNSAYLTEDENRKLIVVEPDIIKRHFPSILSYQVFKILNKTPIQQSKLVELQSKLVELFPKNKCSLGELRVALSELINTGMVEKTEKGVYFSTELGKKVDAELSKKQSTR